MTAEYDSHQAIRTAWFTEMRELLMSSSAWAHVGAIDVEAPSLTVTMGGLLQRKVVPYQKDVPSAKVLEEWRRTPDGKLGDTVLLRANTLLLQRLRPAQAAARESEAWLDEFAQGPIALLGRTPDLLRTIRRIRGVPGAERVHPCAA